MIFRVVLDANLLVSGLLNSHGFPARILNAWRDGIFELVTSRSIMAELKRVLNYPRLARIHKKDSSEIESFLDDLSVLSYMTPEMLTLSVADDPDDDKYLIAAVEGEARYLVTGDSDLLRIAEYGNTSILTAREFVHEITRLGLLK